MMNYEEAMTATRAMEEAQKAYRRDVRFRRLVDSIVHHAMQQHGPIDPDDAERAASHIAQDAAAMMLAAIYEDDAELVALRAERDAYRKIAEDCVSLKPLLPIFLAR